MNPTLTKMAEETISAARSLALSLKPGSCLALFGDLGAGKTTFCKGVISQLTNLDIEEITSPTFTYLQMYEMPNGTPIYHFDLYRLQTANDFISLGFQELLHGAGICLIEWPDNICSFLPLQTVKVFLSHTPLGYRLLEVKS